MRIGKKILVMAIVAGLVATSASATDINHRNVTVTQADTVDTRLTDNGHFMCYTACPPADSVEVRAIDHATGQYFEAAWTILHNTNTEGLARVYDLTSSAAGGDSVAGFTEIRLLAGITYGGDEIVGDSIVVWIWDVDDTCYLFGRGTYEYERNWQGD